MNNSRVHKSFINAKINLVFYFIALFFSFFSRKIFLECLGNDFIGLTGTISNFLDFLNLAELGIGAAIGTVLYKPLFESDRSKINEIISVFGYFYKIVGHVILVAGIIFSLFLPLIFHNTEFPILLIFFIFYSFLTSALIGYYINYKQTLLGADQKNYVVIICYQSVTITKTIVQMLLAYYTGNYYLWVAVELIFGIIYSIILNIRINKVYPWLNADIKNGKALKEKYPQVLKFSKQLFIHKIGSLVQFQIKPLLIYAFVSLQTVAFYGNYSLIVDKLSQLIKNLLGSTGAGVGNLVAEGNKEKIEKVFWELYSINFFIAGVFAFALYYLMSPFISIWVGSGYVLDRTVLIIIIANMFILQTRGTTDQFIFAFGLFSDIWAPFVEVVISIAISIVGGYLWGLPGVLLGSVISMFFIIILWKPYWLFTKGFKRRLSCYWKETAKYVLCAIAAWIIGAIICHGFLKIINPATGYIPWTISAIVIVLSFSFIFAIILFFVTKGFKNFSNRIYIKIIEKIKS